ncbi:PHP domain-containing protein [bacterium]|nr:PHP domain-containing protein [bacterium]
MINTKDSIKKIFENLCEDDYKTIADFHLHTTASDGKIPANQLLEQARKKGLKYFSICDHNTFDGYKLINLQDYPELITGIEFDCWYRGIFLHLLAYGTDINSEDLMPFLAKNKLETEKDIIRFFARRNVKDLIKAIHNAGGIAILAHSACCWTINHEHFVKCMLDVGLDGLEVYYPYKRHRGIIKFHTIKSIKMIAEKYNLIKTGGTDTHGELI